jgi:hypothetical protein
MLDDPEMWTTDETQERGRMAANKKRPKANAAPGTSALDRRALRALFGTYWTAGGWRDALGNAQQPPTPPAAEVEYAQAAGYMFKPRRLTHDQIIGWLGRARASR